MGDPIPGQTPEGVIQDNEILQSVEEEKKTPVYLMFRENEALNAYRDIIASAASEDRKVEVKTFSAETEFEEIANWIRDNKSVVETHELLVDGTVGNRLRDAGMSEERWIGNPDEIIQEAVDRAILGETSDKLPEYSRKKMIDKEEVKQLEGLIVEKILSALNPEDLPKKVNVDENKMHEHCTMGLGDSEYAAVVASYFNKLGIEAEAGMGLSYSLNLVGWIIVDRHTHTGRKVGWPKIDWPLSSFYYSVKNHFPYLEEKYQSRIVQEIKLKVKQVLDKE